MSIDCSSTVRVDVVVAIIFYFFAHLKDPGYVPNDPAFFIALEKEQEDVILLFHSKSLIPNEPL